MKKIISNTTIAVIRNRKTNKLMMAGERRITVSDGTYYVSPVPKVVNNNGILLGATGEGYLCGLVTMDINITPKLPNQSTYDYMKTTFLSCIESVLMSKNYIDNFGNYKFPANTFCELLVGINKEVYVIWIQKQDEDSIIQVHPCIAPYAIGCGGEMAMGSILSTENSKLSDRNRLILALSVAAERQNGADDVIDIIEE